MTKLLAFMVQSLLDEHKKANPEFGVSARPVSSRCVFVIVERLFYFCCFEIGVQKVADRSPATLVITDRSMDMVAPFVHEFTYQAMANDLLPIEDGTKYTSVAFPFYFIFMRNGFDAELHRYKFQSSVGAYEDKTATLSDADSVWTEVRHMHMREAIDKLMADFNKFIQDNAGFKGCVLVPRRVVDNKLNESAQQGGCG